MTKGMYRFLRCVGLALAVGAAGAASAAWPDRPIRMIVPLPPGGGGDSVARLVSAELTKRLGQTVVVENRSGGSSIIGTQAVARAPNDGYTFLFATDFHVINGAFGNLPYDSVEDFAMVAQLIDFQIVLLSRPNRSWKSLADMVAQARKTPGKVIAASPGTSSPHYLAYKLLEQMAGIEFLNVPYQGTGPVTAAFLGDQVDLMFAGVGAGKVLVEQGRAVPLAVTGPERDRLLPNLPTVAESGYPGYSIVSWMAVMAPAGTPADIVDRMNKAIRATLAEKSVQSQLTDLGFSIRTGSPDDLKKLVVSDIKKLRGVIQAAHIQAENR